MEQLFCDCLKHDECSVFIAVTANKLLLPNYYSFESTTISQIGARAVTNSRHTINKMHICAACTNFTTRQNYIETQMQSQLLFNQTLFKYNSPEITYRRFGGADVMCQKRDKMYYTQNYILPPCSYFFICPAYLAQWICFAVSIKSIVNNITRHLQPTLVVYNDGDDFIWRAIHYYARLFYHNASNDYIILYRVGNLCHYVVCFMLFLSCLWLYFP